MVRSSLSWFSCTVFLATIVLNTYASSAISVHDMGYMSNSLVRAISRVPRLLSFETLDDNMKVDMQLTVPFLLVPIQKNSSTTSLDISKRSVNVNMAAIVLSGILVLAGASLSSSMAYFSRNGKDRSLDNTLEDESSVIGAINQFEDFLGKYNVSLTPCVHMGTCYFVQKSSENVNRREASSVDKMIDGITSMDWLLAGIRGTAIYDAIHVGKSGGKCHRKYSECVWNDELLFRMVDLFM